MESDYLDNLDYKKVSSVPHQGQHKRAASNVILKGASVSFDQRDKANLQEEPYTQSARDMSKLLQ